MSSPGQWTTSFDRPLATFAILLVILLLMGPPDGILSANEENYFGLAAQSLAPLTASPYSALFDTSHHRFLNEFLLGHLIAGVGFEGAQMIARALAAGLGAWALSLLVGGLNVRGGDAALAVMGFSVVGQTLFGGEWLFKGYESKVAAYILVIFGLHAMMTRTRVEWGVAAFIAATYFHFQVGGFWFLAGLLYLWIAGELRRPAIVWVATYSVAILPLLFIVISDRLHDVAAVGNGARSANVIYSLIRAPHHAEPFANWPAFFDRWLPGLLAAALMLAGAVSIALRTRTLALRRLGIWIGLLLGYLLIAAAVSFLDRDTGALGKFYLFRPASLSLLLWLILIAAGARELNVATGRTLRLVFAAAIVPAFLLVSIGDIRAQAARQNETRSEKERLFAAVTSLAGPRDVVLIDPTLEHDYDDFERRTGRATLVNWKFDNSSDREIVEWDRRVRSRAALFDEGCGPRLKWPVRFLVVAPGRMEHLASCGAVVYRDDKVGLIRVRHPRPRRRHVSTG